MHKYRHFINAILATTFIAPGLVCGEESDPTFHVEATDNFFDVADSMKNYLETQMILENPESQEALNQFSLDIKMTHQGIQVTPKAAKAPNRQYAASVTPKEKEKIRYIVTTLGHQSIPHITSARSNLKKTGSQINHIHPLKFLITVFTDEEIKAGIHAIRGRAIGWIWDEFAEGLIKSLKEETANQNMKMEYIQDFANTIRLNINLILPSIQQGKWLEFINILIDNVPRQNDPRRYDM